MELLKVSNITKVYNTGKGMRLQPGNFDDNDGNRKKLKEK